MGRMGMSTMECSSKTQCRQQQSLTINKGGKYNDNNPANEVRRGASNRGGIFLGNVWKEAPD
jgi:hypothetical protein